MLKVPNVPQGINIDVWKLFPDHYQVVQTITGPLLFPPILKCNLSLWPWPWLFVYKVDK